MANKKSIAFRLANKSAVQFNFNKFSKALAPFLEVFSEPTRLALEEILTKLTEVKRFKVRDIDHGYWSYDEVTGKSQGAYIPCMVKEYKAFGDNFEIMFSHFPEAKKSFDQCCEEGIPFYKHEQFETEEENRIYARGNQLIFDLLTKFKEVLTETDSVACIPVWDPSEELEGQKETSNMITENQLFGERFRVQQRQKEGTYYSCKENDEKGILYPIATLVATSDITLIAISVNGKKISA